MRTLAFAIATIFALNTGVALAADPPKAPAAKTDAANKAQAQKKAPKKNADAKKTPAPASAPAAKK